MFRSRSRQSHGIVAETISYTTHSIPLECNPDPFPELIHKLGVSSNLTFQDVPSLDPDMLAFVLLPVLALFFVFPTSDVYEKERTIEESVKEDSEGRGEMEDVTWFKQTINNACGFYGMPHAICNGEAREMIGINTAHIQIYYLLTKLIAPDSIMARTMSSCIPLGPADRAKVIENSRIILLSFTNRSLVVVLCTLN